MAGAQAERQENGIVKAVTDAYRANGRNPITLQVGNTTLIGIVGAKKYTGRQASGSEPYTDIILTTHKGENINLSCKGEAAPSLAGGGLRGIETILPGIARRFYTEAYKYMKVTLKAKPGDQVPDIYGQLSRAEKTKLVVGNKAVGGPIDYMYIGPMTVVGKYNKAQNVLTLNANLIESVEYANAHNLFFRLRKRREDQRFDPDALGPGGIPRIYGKSPSKGDQGGRLVVTDQVPKNATVISF